MSEGGVLGRLTVSFIDKELIKHKEAENKSKQQQSILNYSFSSTITDYKEYHFRDALGFKFIIIPFSMSFGVDTAKLNKIIELYLPNNRAEEMKYMLHLHGQEELFINLQTCPFQGISNDSLADRKSHFGINQIQFKQTHLLQPFVSTLAKSTVHLPLLLSILVFLLETLSLAGDQGFKTIVIVVLCFANWVAQSLERFWFRLRVAKTIRTYQQQSLQVVRENTKIRVVSNEIVVGDVLIITPGITIPADGWIVQGEDIIVAQPHTAGMTQQSKNTFRRCLLKLKEKREANGGSKRIQSEQSPVLIGGSIVRLGEGRMVVLAVGSNSRQGRLLQFSKLTHHYNHTTSKLKAILDSLFNGLAKGVVLFLILFCLKAVYRAWHSEWKSLLKIQMWQQLLAVPSALILGIPQGVQIGVIVGQWLIKMRLWVRSSIWVNCSEDVVKMSAVNLLCFDKSQQDWRVIYREWWNEENHQQIRQNDEEGKNIETEEVDLQLHDQICNEFKHMFQVTHIFKQCRQPQQHCPLDHQPVSFCCNEWDIAQEMIDHKLVNYILQHDSIKYVFYHEHASQIVYVLSRAENIIERSHTIISKSTAEVSILTPPVLNQIRDTVSSMSRRLMSSLAIGYFHLQHTADLIDRNFSSLQNRQLTFLCLLGASGIREHSAYKILRSVKQLGIKMMLLTDCPLDEAEKRARQIGVNTVDQDTVALTGLQFTKLVQGLQCLYCKKTMCVCAYQQDNFTIKNAEELRKAQRFLRVIGQANAQQKYCLMIGMQAIGNLTAHIGSIQEDIAAMAKSYLSITAKGQLSEAAAVVLPKYDMRLIHELILWSRFTYDFLCKCLQLGLPSSIVAAILLLVGTLGCDMIVFKLIPLVWTVSVVCPLVAATLCLQKPEQSLMTEKLDNFGKQSELISWSVKKQIVTQIFWQTLLLFIVLFTGHLFIPQSADSVDQVISLSTAKYSGTHVANGLYTNPLIQTPSYETTFNQYHLFSRHLTFVYNLYTLMQIFNFFNCRHTKDTRINILQGIQICTLISLAFILFSHVLFMQLLSKYVGLYPNSLTIQQWLISVGLAITVCIVSFAARLLPPQNQKKLKKRRGNRSTSLAVKSGEKLKQFSNFEIEQVLEFSQQ